MFQSYVAHYKNKYPKCQIKSSDSSFDVYSEDGHHLIALRKNGAGQLQDHSEEMGCEERHDLAPIPKESRAWKLYASGVVGKSEEHEERKAFVAKNCKKCPVKGYAKVPSIHEGGIKEDSASSEPAKKKTKK